ncbi:MAG: MFS transporter, partial [Thermomicrobiales bacterium]
EPLGAALLAAAREAFVQGLQLTAVIGAVGLAGMAILAAVFLRHVETSPEPERQAAPNAGVPEVDGAQVSKPLDLAA